VVGLFGAGCLVLAAVRSRRVWQRRPRPATRGSSTTRRSRTLWWAGIWCRASGGNCTPA